MCLPTVMNHHWPQFGGIACFAIQTFVDPLPDGVIPLGNRVFAASSLPVIVDGFWEKEIGAIDTKAINECNLFLFEVAEGNDDSPNTLISNLHSYYYSLLLQSTGYSRTGFLLGGKVSNGQMNVNSLGRMHEYYQPRKVDPPNVNGEGLLKTIPLVLGIERIYAKPNSENAPFLRIRKGFSSFLKGVQETALHERLHQFVRAIEAAIMPLGRYTRNFKYRSQMFTGLSPGMEVIMGELYEMRSAAEHLNPLKTKLGGYQAHEHQNIIALRTYQAELLAGFIYQKILSSEDILNQYESDESIANLWAQKTRDLIKFWGTTIDIEATAKQHFRDFLD